MSKFYNNKKLVLFILVLVVMLGAFSVFKIITLNTPQEATVYNEAKIYGPSTGMETITGDAEIDAAGAQLQNMTFAGNLTITKSVGDGDVTLKNVTVEGNVYVKGGGANSIHLIDCTISAIYVEHNGVRVVAEGSTTVQQVNLFSSGMLAEEGIAGAGFINFTIPQDAPAGITASLAGDFNSITIKADQTHLSVLSGTIVRMLVAQGADGAVIDLSNSVAINTLNINSKIQVTGTGRIDSAISTVDGSSFETAPIASTPPATDPDTETGNGSGTSTGTDTSTGTGTGTNTGTGTGTDTGTGTGTGGGGGVATLSFLNIALSPAGSMTATPSSPTFIMTFDRGLADYWTTNKDCFKIYKDGTAINVLNSSDVTMIDKNNIQLSPSGLIAGASYNIVVSASLQANNGNTLGSALTKSFTVAPASGGSTTAEISGTAATATESDIVAGGKTIIVTLSNGTFGTQIASSSTKREALIDGLTTSSDTAEWAEVIAALKVAGTGAVTRDSDTQVTITLPATAGYNITGNQTITLNIPSGSISGVSSTVTATPGITITSAGVALTAAISGTAATAAESDIVAGGKTIIVTLSNGTFGTQIASSSTKREALIDGLTTGSETAEWAEVIAALKAAGTAAVTRDSDTQVTITLPATVGYNIAGNQTITLNIPSGSISGVSSTVIAAPTVTIKAAVTAEISGTATTATEADIVTGGKTIIVTLSNGTFASQISSSDTKRNGLIDGLTAGSDTTEWAEVITALKATGTAAVTRDSDTQVTITLPATAGYNITGNQTITLNIPSGSISGVSSTLIAAPVVTLTAI